MPDHPELTSEMTRLPSGRCVSVRADDGEEAVEVRSADGRLELRLVLTADGPVLRLRGVRLEVEAGDTVALRCKDFLVEAAGEIRLRSGGDTRVDADFVRLNCESRAGSGYHDDPERSSPPPTPELPGS
jgi:hypothetical protein